MGEYVMPLIVVCVSIMTIVISLSFLILRYRSKKREFQVTNFESYIALQEFFMLKAYDIIYKDRILIYSLEAVKLDDKEFKQVTKDYLNLVLKLMGNALAIEFITLYGDQSTFYFNLTEYFNSKFEEDEIRKSSVDNVMNSETE